MTSIQQDIESMGKLLAKTRHERGVSSFFLSDAVGITESELNDFEEGKCNVGSSKLFEIATVLQVPVTVFLSEFTSTNMMSTPASKDNIIDFVAAAKNRKPSFSRIQKVFEGCASPGNKDKLLKKIEEIIDEIDD